MLDVITWEAAQLKLLQTKQLRGVTTGLSDWRRAQLDAFIQHGFPTRHHEAWKYTNLSKLSETSFKLQAEKINPAALNCAEFTLSHAYRIVFVNGIFVEELSALDDLPTKIQIRNIQESMLQDSRVQSLNSSNNTVFTLFNAAFNSDGIYLKIPKNLILTKPIHLLHLSVANANVNDLATLQPIRHVIEAGEHSEVTIFEDYQGLENASYFNNVVTHLIADANAKIKHYKLQQESAKAFHIANTTVMQNKNSSVNSWNFSLGAQISRDDLNMRLLQSSADCVLHGFYHGKDQQIIDHHTRIDHHSAHCNSAQNYKGIADEKSQCIFNGKVIVHPHAQHTFAQQSNKNLLLTKTAEIDTKPELEIYADDVKCTHGATVGALDPRALFYLQSRGIDITAAKKLLLQGFVGEILDTILNADIKQYIATRVFDRFDLSGDAYD